MNGTLRDPAWWSWQPSGGGCRTVHRLRAPGAESYLSGRGWPESWWETPWTVGPRPLELQAGRTYDLFVSTSQCDRCSHLCTDPLTDQTLRQELLGLDWESSSHRLGGHIRLMRPRLLLDPNPSLPCSASAQKLEPLGRGYQGFWSGGKGSPRRQSLTPSPYSPWERRSALGYSPTQMVHMLTVTVRLP